MKIQSIALTLFTLALAIVSLQAHEKGRTVAGPNGGRILEKVEPRAEFFVTAERKVQITFLDKANKPVAPAEQVVTVTVGQRISPTKLAFEKSGNSFLSTTALPSGDDYPAVVQIKPTASGKTTTERFTLDTTKCGECKLGEYACICAH